jgi:hypothetical protein
MQRCLEFITRFAAIADSTLTGLHYQCVTFCGVTNGESNRYGSRSGAYA